MTSQESCETYDFHHHIKEREGFFCISTTAQYTVKLFKYNPYLLNHATNAYRLLKTEIKTPEQR
jgi:hypothetical protein